MKQFYLTASIIFISVLGRAQTQFSFACDLSALHNLSPEQRLWTLGSTVQGNFHFSPKGSAYTWISFFSPARFSNRVTAIAKSSGTFPETQNVDIRTTWTFRNLSLGWKHYFKGAYNDETSWNLYGIAGFGLQVVKVQNDYKTAIDTSVYRFTGPQSGISNVARLSLDLGLGVEYSLGADYYVYADLRTWYPTSNHPSAWFYNSERTPFPVTFGIGFRILFSGY